MAKKKCPHCQSCYNLVWVGSNRYYHCWLCGTWFTGQDSELVQVDNPYANRNVPLEELKEQDDA